eukprot:COSAG04_NODE_1192_length_7801_cov_7.001298_2_plen_177_part_00
MFAMQLMRNVGMNQSTGTKHSPPAPPLPSPPHLPGPPALDNDPLMLAQPCLPAPLYTRRFLLDLLSHFRSVKSPRLSPVVCRLWLSRRGFVGSGINLVTGLQQRSVLNSLIYKKAMRLTNDARNADTQVTAAPSSPALPRWKCDGCRVWAGFAGCLRGVFGCRAAVTAQRSPAAYP